MHLLFYFRYKSWFWVPIVGPFIGAIIGAWLYQLTIGFHTPQDVEEKYVVLTGNQELKPLTGKEQLFLLILVSTNGTLLLKYDALCYMERRRSAEIGVYRNLLTVPRQLPY
ncbi:hypothetical protein ANCCAN_06887 [Ancylostoma caninum]|uniref:Aquaporin-9 domain protein n=1 Tax=Ancylostoma caninum TaxID=29170 RepID=A0A368GRR2_ANCCA|nr:hypothetical protein ANCCAN_06887 [Ancylostoma caninum]